MPEPLTPNLNRAREAQAEAEVGETTITTRTAWTLVVGFALLIASGFVAELLAPRAAMPSLDLAASLRDGGCALRDFEREVERDSPLAVAVRPAIQAGLVALGRGNAAVVNTGGGGLALRSELRHLVAPDFTSPRVQRAREAARDACDPPVHADPVAAARELGEMLAARGIRLVVMPTPGKLAIEPERMGAGPGPILQTGQAALRAQLEEAGIEVFDPTTVLQARREQTGTPVYLERDSHWRPDAVDAVARELARRLGLADPHTGKRGSRSAVAARNVGDLAALLDQRRGAEQVSLEAPNSETVGDAPVLLLGDSYAAIYSDGGAFARRFDPSLSWGQGAGLPDQLAYYLGRGVRRITRNAGGGTATREALAIEIARSAARGEDYLAGVEAVVWQLAARELSVGSFDPVAWTTPVAQSTTEKPPPTPMAIRIHARLAARSGLPEPGSTPYGEAVFAAHLVDVVDAATGAPWPGADPGGIVVYLLGMEGQRATPAATLSPGDPITVRLEPWDDPSVQTRVGSFSRSELEDLSLLSRPAFFGKLTP